MIGEKCLKIPFNSNIAGLQSRRGLHITFYGLKEASLFGTYLCKNQTIIILMFINEKKKNDVKMIVPSSIANHVVIAISLQIIAIRYFFKIVQP